MRVSSLLSTRLLRATDGVRTRWILWRVRGATEEYVKRYGTPVRSGYERVLLGERPPGPMRWAHPRPR